MEAKAGIVRIGIPTGLGRNGVRKEALEIAKRMLQEMSSKPVTHKWCKYYIPAADENSSFYGTSRWGMVVSAHVENVEYAKAIMLSFEYDEVALLDLERNEEWQDYFLLKKRQIGFIYDSKKDI
jgi:hypothetical protein